MTHLRRSLSAPRRNGPAPPSPRRRPAGRVALSPGLLGPARRQWTLLVVRDLFAGRTRYGELAGSMEKIPTNLLADRLNRLEAAGIVARTPYQDNPPRHAYTLTPIGEELRPVMQAIVNWGRRHLPGTMVRAEVTGNRADSPFLPSWIKLPAHRAK